MTALAFIGIGLRLQQYGLTPERIIAAAWALIAVFLPWAMPSRLASRRPDEAFGAHQRRDGLVILGLVAMLFTPIADPARLSVAQQVHRLDAGRITPDALDYSFLRFQAARYGREALQRMAARKGTASDIDIAVRAASALKRKNPWDVMAKPAELASHLIVYPKGQAWPKDFTTQDWASDFSLCLQKAQTAIPTSLILMATEHQRFS